MRFGSCWSENVLANFAFSFLNYSTFSLIVTYVEWGDNFPLPFALTCAYTSLYVCLHLGNLICLEVWGFLCMNLNSPKSLILSNLFINKASFKT